jgi:hypothetical protein
LRAAGETIKKVSHLLGFSSASYFSYAFRRATGASRAQLRQFSGRAARQFGGPRRVNTSTQLANPVRWRLAQDAWKLKADEAKRPLSEPSPTDRRGSCER